MSLTRNLRHLFLLSSIAGLSGFTAACVIGEINKGCGEVGTKSDFNADGLCQCDTGLEWCHPEDADAGTDFRCCTPSQGDQCPGANNFYDSDQDRCFCEPGFDWCFPEDNDDLSCCGGGTGNTSNPTSDTTGGTGDTGGQCSPGSPAPGTDPDDADCTAETEGQGYCTHVFEDGPWGSVFYECQGGSWVQADSVGDQICTMDGFAFSFGCVEELDGQGDCTDPEGCITFLCGDGPGTDCDFSGGTCGADGDTIDACHLGKLASDTCSRLCSEVGDENGIQYDSGNCVDDGGQCGAACACCDFGEEGCE